MKKVLVLFVLLISLSFTACQPTEETTTTTEASGTTTTTEAETSGETTTTRAPIDDTNPPGINGASDVQMYMRESFDAMEGVSAFDDVDGNVTDDIAVSGTVDTETAGEYILTYTVSDEAGNEATEERVVTVIKPDWFVYGMERTVNEDSTTIAYSEVGDSWWTTNAQHEFDSFDGSYDKLKITFSGEEGHEYLFKVEGDGGNTEKSVTATGDVQEFILPMDDMTEAERDQIDLMIFFVTTVGATGSVDIYGWEYVPEWIGYGMDVTKNEASHTIDYADVTSTWWDFSAQYEISSFDGTKDAIKIFFNGTEGHDYLFKIEGEDGNAELDVTATGEDQELILPLDSLTEAERDTLDLLVFFVQNESTTETLTGSVDIYGWEYATDWTGYDMEVIEDESSTTINYTDVASPWWDFNAQYGIDSVDPNTEEVRITFTGTADHVYLFKIEGAEGNTELEVTATGSEQEFILPLDSLTETQIGALDLLVFFAKNESTTETWTGSIEITNIEFVLPDWIGYGMDVTESESSVTIDYTNVDSSWWNDNAQYTFDPIDPNTKEVKITFTGTADHVYLFKIEGDEGNTELAVTATGSEQEFILPLDSLTETDIAALNLLVVFAKNESTTETWTGSIEITDIEFVMPEWIGYGMDITENASSFTIDYADIGSSWWNDNAQHPIDSFDGTNDAIKITFTGTTDHVYLFKIEGDEGNTELEVTATGSLQEFILPLDDLTEVQRDALDLLVFFVKTEGATGNIEIEGWEYASTTE